MNYSLKAGTSMEHIDSHRQARGTKICMVRVSIISFTHAWKRCPLRGLRLRIPVSIYTGDGIHMRARWAWGGDSDGFAGRIPRSGWRCPVFRSTLRNRTATEDGSLGEGLRKSR